MRKVFTRNQKYSGRELVLILLAPFIEQETDLVKLLMLDKRLNGIIKYEVYKEVLIRGDKAVSYSK